MKSAALVALLALAALVAPGAGAAGAEGWRLVRLVEQDEFMAFDAASLNLFDFDGDGRPEIVSSNDNGRVYVVGMERGRVLARIETTHPDGWNARDINPVAIGDLYGDGTPCLVIPNSAAYLSAWCYDGKTITGRLDFERRWEIRVDAAEFEPDFRADRPWLADQQPSMDGAAFLADVDGRPGLEVFVETDGYPGQFSFTHEGAYRWHNAWWDGNAGAVVSDLDGDGKKEAVFASDGGVIACYDADTGKLEWRFEASEHGADPGSITLAPLVADIAGDEASELVFGARGATGGLDGSHATWFALRADGSVLWKRSYDWMNPLVYTHPAAVDVDGDGALDVVALDWNTLGHKPGNWEPTARGPTLFALRGEDGSAIWHRSVPAYWSNKDVVVAGDEVIANAAQGGRDGLATYALDTGSHVGWFGLPAGWEATRGPVAAEVGGRLFLVVPLAKPEAGESTLDVGQRQGALAIVDAGPARELRFSANLLHTDAEASAATLRTHARIPAPSPLALLAVVAAAACVAGRRR